MPICPTCGSENRAGARFCWNCATPLAEPFPLQRPARASRPTQEDISWLAATLLGNESSHAMVWASGYPTIPLSVLPDSHQEYGMDQAQDQTQPIGPTRIGERYEVISADALPAITVKDRQPWRRCWACGSLENEAGESFCIHCGAALEERTYHGLLVPVSTDTGIVLIATVEDETARAMLPMIWDQVEEDGQILILQRTDGTEPLALPLDELAALRLGLHLARLLEALHAQGLALGAIDQADLEVTAAGQPRLRNTPNLRRYTSDESAAAIRTDLHELASLLAALTSTPRTTQRLSEDAASIALEEPDLAQILYQVRTDAITTAAELAVQFEALLNEQTRPLPLYQRVGAYSDIGIVRDHNEDSFLVLHLSMDNNATRRACGLYIVADGMGGHAAGEVASGLAIRGATEVLLREYLTPTLDLDADYDRQAVQAIVHQAIMQANEYVLREGQARGNDMGTTLTMALVVGDRVIIGNVGDSRAYLYRDGALRRISKDHSLVMRLVELGQITEDDIYSHPQRNAVLRSLGDKLDIEIDLFYERVHAGDALLLCSDGQWEMTRDPEMVRILADYPDPQQACQHLVAAANQAGGEDNITSVLIKFEC